MNNAPNNQIAELEYIIEKTETRIKVFQSSVKWYRRRFFAATMSSVVLSALITLIAGWKHVVIKFFVIEIDSSNLILILSGFVTVISTWGAFFAPKESWLIYASTLNNLQALKTELEFIKISTREPTQEKLNQLFEKYQSILASHNKTWLELRSSIKKETPANSSIATKTLEPSK